MENILTIKSTLKINLKQKKEPLDSNSPDWKYLAHDPSNPKENYIVVSEKSFKIYYKGEEMPSHSPLRGKKLNKLYIKRFLFHRCFLLKRPLLAT